MNKKTKILFLEMAIGIILFGLLLYFVDNYNAGPKESTFLGYVVEVYDGAILIQPFPDDKISRSYDYIFASIIGVSIGDVIEVTHGPDVKETNPASIDVIRYKVIIRAPQIEPVCNDTLIPQ